MTISESSSQLALSSLLLHENGRRPGDLAFTIRLGTAESFDYTYVVVGHLAFGARPDSGFGRTPVGHLVGGGDAGIAELVVVAISEFDVSTVRGRGVCCSRENDAVVLDHLDAQNRFGALHPYLERRALRRLHVAALQDVARA